VTFNIRVEPLAGDRWRARIDGLPGAVGYGDSPEAALQDAEDLAAAFVTSRAQPTGDEVDLRVLLQALLRDFPISQEPLP